MLSANLPEPLIIPRPEHPISRANISPNALKVLNRLKQAGFQAYLVGGGVRDLLLGHEPKDFDIATDATPEEVRSVFRNCRLIGRRFRLAHVFFGREIVEVATFRGSNADGGSDAQVTEQGMILRDNVYGSITEDALRRDFTVNALYYNIADFSLVDYAGGLADIEEGRLRLIGDDPVARYREDPVRMLRAVRFACKLGFIIDDDCAAPIRALAELLGEISPARLFEETLKLFHSGYALQAFEKLRHFDLFAQLFPETDACLAREDHAFPITFVSRGLDNTDQRILEGKPVAPAFLFAVLLWEPVRLRYQALLDDGVPSADAMALASQEVASAQQQWVAIQKRFALPMREIWALQPRLERRQGKRPMLLLSHPRFRAAYDFLLLRAEAGETDPEIAQWWTRFQAVDAAERAKMLGSTPQQRKRKRRKRKPKSDSLAAGAAAAAGAGAGGATGAMPADGGGAGAGSVPPSTIDAGPADGQSGRPSQRREKAHD
ncbi:polynucleotide adenylyltransferase PcnB [Lamprobacter modestohalophilus]|uniref:polynucleotide adenylyltransferase PcnB n=1 Tax=Lamprobacter modestohalophilus TaxID=1064514 RepID=UPI001F5BA7DC|nr:polynucleotide adenylyltransferase PcnB [Lamprobacter modestohalophilus]MEA1051443.1 polynucleotide adenylyltransferase PcnB [Lamprobacter modestohalophilus]